MFPARDIVVGDIPANFSGTKTVTIPNYPCGAGTVCFGAKGSEADGGFPKGAACPSGQCCSTVSWNVKASDPCPDTTRQISSKCRHQQICIIGRGTTTLDCNNTTAGIQTSCPVECGATTTLTLCTTSPASFGPFTFTLGDQSYGPTAAVCHEFVVGPITADTTFTGTVTDATGCAKSASATVTTTPLTASIAVSGNTACDDGPGVTFTATAAGGSGCTFQWSVDGTAVSGATGASFKYPANPDNTCHTVSVHVACGGCNADASTTVKQCINTTSGCTPPA